jgi:threonine aldolase
MLGGGMRQAGVMAAAGIVALQSGIERLAEDHANARRLAEGLAERFPGSCNPEMVETNLFHVQVAAFGVSGNELAAYLANQGILVFAGDPRMRLATHCNVSAADIAAVLAVFDTLRNQRKSIRQAGLPGEPIPVS